MHIMSISLRYAPPKGAIGAEFSGKKQMLDYARNLEFEKAAEARDRLAELKRSVFDASPEESVRAVG